MEFWCFVIGVVVVIIAIPYIRCFFKRLVCLGKIRRMCRERSFQLHKTHFWWFLGNKYAPKCDCYIETPNEVFAVKLFGMPKRLSVLIFKENGDYVIRSFIALLPSVRFTFHSKPRALPVYDFRYQYRIDWEIKTPHHILLVNPISMEIRRQPHNGGEVIVGAGDVINGMEIESLPRFLGTLENAI